MRNFFKSFGKMYFEITRYARSVYFLCSFILLLSGSFLFGTSEILAQDAHYWSNEYGSRSALMGGAVVGGVRDTSAGFYNPGALAFVDNSSLSVSGNAFSYRDTNIRNGAGTGENLNSQRVEAFPTLLSGILRFKNLPEHTFGYSILTRSNNSYKFIETVDSVRDVVSGTDYPGDEDFIGQVNAEGRMYELWLGGSYAYKINPNISVGATLFGSLRTQDASYSHLARAINQETEEISSLSFSQTYDYFNFRALAKLGVSADFSPLRIGLTFTTPSVNVGGSGESASDLTVTSENYLDYVANDRQDSLSTKYRTPLSFALGIEYEFESTGTVVAFVSEYFDRQNVYSIINPEERPFLRPSSIDYGFSSKEFLQVEGGSASVVNYGFGIEQKINDKYSAYLSFRRDNSYLLSIEDESISLSHAFLSYNLYHTTLGAAYRDEKAETALGIKYSYGRDKHYSQFVDFSSASEENSFEGNPGEASLNYRAITLILGYTHFF